MFLLAAIAALTVLTITFTIFSVIGEKKNPSFEKVLSKDAVPNSKELRNQNRNKVQEIGAIPVEKKASTTIQQAPIIIPEIRKNKQKRENNNRR